MRTPAWCVQAVVFSLDALTRPQHNSNIAARTDAGSAPPAQPLMSGQPAAATGAPDSSHRAVDIVQDKELCPAQLAGVTAAVATLVLELLAEPAARTATQQRALKLQLDLLQALQRTNWQLPAATCHALLAPDSPLVALRCACRASSRVSGVHAHAEAVARLSGWPLPADLLLSDACCSLQLACSGQPPRCCRGGLPPHQQPPRWLASHAPLRCCCRLCPEVEVAKLSLQVQHLLLCGLGGACSSAALECTAACLQSHLGLPAGLSALDGPQTDAPTASGSGRMQERASSGAAAQASQEQPRDSHQGELRQPGCARAADAAGEQLAAGQQGSCHAGAVPAADGSGGQPSDSLDALHCLAAIGLLDRAAASAAQLLQPAVWEVCWPALQAAGAQAGPLPCACISCAASA